MLNLNKKITAIALLSVITLAGTTLQVNSASARGVKVSPGVVRGAKQGASIGNKGGELVNKWCEFEQQKNPNKNHQICNH